MSSTGQQSQNTKTAVEEVKWETATLSSSVGLGRVAHICIPLSGDWVICGRCGKNKRQCPICDCKCGVITIKLSLPKDRNETLTAPEKSKM